MKSLKILLVVLLVVLSFVVSLRTLYAQTAEELKAQVKAEALLRIDAYKKGSPIPPVVTKEEIAARVLDVKNVPREDKELKERLFRTIPAETLTIVLETWGFEFAKTQEDLDVIADRVDAKYAEMNKTRQERDLWQLSYFRKEYGRKSGFTAQQWAAEIIRFAEATSKIELNAETGVPENKFSGKVIPQIASMYVLFSAKATTEEKIVLNDQLFKTLPYDEGITQKFLQFLAKQKKEIVPEP